MRATPTFLSLCSLVVCLTLTGCTFTGAGTAAPTAQKVTLAGSVYGGSVPVTGAHVYLFAANTNGYAGPGLLASPTNASISLLQAAPNTSSDSSGDYYVTTGTNGTFSLNGDYTACTPGEQLYLYATGGNAGAGSNSAIGMMAIVGGCTATYPNSSTSVSINEMSTVAAAYAIAGFASDSTHIADDEAVSANTTAALAQSGMANAFANSANLVTLGTGAALYTTPVSSGLIPTTTLNTIASLLANCVQTSGPNLAPCVDLFTFTGTPSNGDTATAAIRLAQNPAGAPGNHLTISTLLNSLPQNVAYTPVLLNPPNDFTIPIVYSGTGLNGPSAVAIDATGSIWVTNSGGNSVSQFSSTADTYSETDYADTSINQPSSVAIDLTGNIWLTNYGAASLTEFSGSGTNYAATAYTGAGLALPVSIAVDGNNNVWALNLYPSSVSEFSGSGINYTGTNYTGLHFPAGVAVDASEDIWTSDTYDGVAAEFTPATNYTPVKFTNPGIGTGTALGIDANGSIWVASGGGGNNGATQTLGEFSGPSNNYATLASYSGGGLDDPASLALDGAGNVWLANSSGYSLSEFTNLGVALSPASTGFTGTSSIAGDNNGPLAGPTGIAIDASGNVWVSDSSNSAIEFIGAASPAVVPLAAAVHLNKIGTRP